jgi:hypothetical protein
MLVYHADSGADPKMHWLCKGIRSDFSFVAHAPTLVGDLRAEHNGVSERLKPKIGSVTTNQT